MALSAATVFEVRSDGADTNGGGFVAGGSGTDRSQQAAAFASGVNLTVDAATNTDVAPDGYSPVAADVDNTVQITTTGGGAAFTLGFYRIVSIQAGKWRLDRSPAAISSAGATWAMGGALATDGKAANAVQVAGQTVWFRGGATPASTPIVATVAVSNVAGGRAAWSVACKLLGYGTTRGDKVKAVLKTGVATLGQRWQISANGVIISDLDFDGNKTNFAGNAVGLLSSGLRFKAYRCLFHDFTLSGVSANTGTLIACDCYSNGGSGATIQQAFYSRFSNNVSNGVQLQSYGTLVNCAVYGNASGGVSLVFPLLCFGVVSYGNTGAGFTMGTEGDHLVNCVAYGNSTYGVAGGDAGAILTNCAVGNNTTANIQNASTVQQENLVTLTANPFTDPANGDFRLNATAGGGASLKATGYGTLGSTLTVGTPDIGPYQGSSAGGGGSSGGGRIGLGL